MVATFDLHIVSVFSVVTFNKVDGVRIAAHCCSHLPVNEAICTVLSRHIVLRITIEQRTLYGAHKGFS